MRQPGRAFFNATDDAGDAFEDDGTWDSPGKVFGLGLGIPLLLLGWIGVNLWQGGVWVRQGRFSGYEFYSFSGDFAVAGTIVLLKLIAAGVAFTWYVIGNHPTLGWHRDKILLGLLLLGGTAVVGAFLSTLL